MKNIVFYFTVAALACVPMVCVAGDPPPFPEFTFKMGTPPKAGAGRRITVQITQEDDAAINSAPTPESEDGTAGAPRYGWFWDQVPTGYTDTATLRFESALLRLSKPPQGEHAPAPRLQGLQKIAAAQGQNILVASIGAKVSPALVLAVMAVESGGRVDATSGAGAEGLMQLIPATAERFGVSNSLSELDNIKGGVAYLDWLLDEFGGDPILALAGYNAGENAVRKHEGVPPFAETRDYIPKVLAAYDVARGLCKTRPVFVTDGCAFNLALDN